ncbi:unnamed protein product [Alopecurus aequalis]
MAALLRNEAARRLGGSVLERTKAALTSPAVAEERRRLVPRRMFSTVEEQLATRKKVLSGIQQKKEEAYNALAEGQQSFRTSSFRNKLLLQHLAVQIKGRPGDSQWRRRYYARKALTVLETAGLISLAYVVSTGVVRFTRKSIANIFKQDSGKHPV